MKKFLSLLLLMTSLVYANEETIFWRNMSKHLEQVNYSPSLYSSQVLDDNYFWPDHVLDNLSDLSEEKVNEPTQNQTAQVIQKPINQNAAFQRHLWHSSTRFTQRDFQLVLKMRAFLDQYFDDNECFRGDKRIIRRELRDYMDSDVTDRTFQRSLSCLYNYGTPEELTKYRQISSNTNWKYEVQDESLKLAK